MRIIGGRYRGKKLVSPSSEKVRPTSDKAREAVFNILRNRLGADFSTLKLVDIFSGSGAFALEAMSQGFSNVTLVDIDTKDLQKNVALFPSERQRIKIVRADVSKALILPEKYNVVFMDAPYNQGLSETALVHIKPFLYPKALCLIEVEKNETCTLPPCYKIVDERRYGLAKILIAEFIEQNL